MTLNYINDDNNLNAENMIHTTLDTTDITTYSTIYDAHAIVAPIRDSIFELSDRVKIMGVDFEDIIKSLTELSMAS